MRHLMAAACPLSDCFSSQMPHFRAADGSECRRPAHTAAPPIHTRPRRPLAPHRTCARVPAHVRLRTHVRACVCDRACVRACVRARQDGAWNSPYTTSEVRSGSLHHVPASHPCITSLYHITGITSPVADMSPVSRSMSCPMSPFRVPACHVPTRPAYLLIHVPVGCPL